VIKTTLESDLALQGTIAAHHEALEVWWSLVRDDFALLRAGKKLPELRQELLERVKNQLVPLGVLDEFKAAGVFVNWWQQIRYDLKTILSTGWHQALIPETYLVHTFFQPEAAAIEAVEAKISESENELVEVVGTAQEVAGYESEEDETVTATVIKRELKELIDDLKDNTGESAQKELKALEAQENAIIGLEKQIRDSKVELKKLTDEIDHKLQLKRLGGEEFQAETEKLLGEVEARLITLNEHDKDHKKQFAALQKDKAILQPRIAKTAELLASIGGVLTDAEAKTLILKKLYDLAIEQLNRYLNAEKRTVIRIVEDLWDKYATSSRELEAATTGTLSALEAVLKELEYLQ
jgi:type I restriction enzyme M protein